MSITRKIISSIGLIAVIPFLVTCYLYMGLSAIILQTGRLVIFITAIIIILGIATFLGLTRTLLRLHQNLDNIANGDFNRKVEVEKFSGTEGMAMSINDVSQKLREGADELEKKAILMERFNREVKRMNYLQKAYFSDIAHELRTPLINIDKNSALLLEKKADIAENVQDNSLRAINDNARRLMRLINNLLDISKLESGEFIMKYELLNIGDVINESVNSLNRWRQSKGLKLGMTISQNLPKVYADRDRIIQVIINLLSNAIKFTPTGGTVVVEAKIFKDSKDLELSENKEVFIEISVEDTGVGIPESQKDKIFDRFKTVENKSADALPCTGLGLPIAKKIAEMHGGKIWVESQPNKGSKFTFIIPQRLQKKQRELGVDIIRKGGVIPESKLIMVVDDEEVVRDVLCTFLRKKGYKTVALKDGESAISYAKKNKPDLIFLDIKMPGLDGIETCDRLKKMLQPFPGTGIIIITGYPTPENVKKSYISEAADVIRKPLDLEDIDRRINTWFQRSRYWL